MDINELDVNDVMAPHPELADPNIHMFPHQLTMLHRMMKLEMEPVDVVIPNVVSRLSMTYPNGYAFSMKTRIGILADKVGAGKSYEILALVLQDAMRMNANANANANAAQVVESARDATVHQMTRFFCSDRLVLTCSVVSQPTAALTVIVVPHALVGQWVHYATRLIGTKLRVGVVHRSRHLPINVDDHDVIIVSTTFHNDIAMLLRDKTVRRVVYDEADNVRIPNCRTISASFHWFATASYRNLLHNDIRSSGFIRSTFADLAYTAVSRALTNAMVLKNRNDFVDASLNVPPIVSCVVLCKSPVAVSVLRGMVDRVVLDCLNAGDVTSAMQHIAPSHRQSETNIVSALVEKLSTKLHNLRIRVEQLETMRFDSPEEQQAEATRLAEKVQAVEQKIASIRQRVQDCDSCCICFNDFTNKTIAPCCSNAYCFACITRWTAHRPLCPLCKSPLDASKVYVVSEEAASASEASGSGSGSRRAAAAELPEKLDQLEAVLRERVTEFDGGRVLLCSGFENTFTSGVIPMLDRMGISHRFLKGNQDTTTGIVRDFKAGRVRVLLVNPNNYGSGLNCEMTTDVILMHKFSTEIEQQVIGRAQRVGRTAPLKVWSLLYENEAT